MSRRTEELAALDKVQEAQRRKLLRRTLADIQRVLDNTDGLERLANITDDEWNAAGENEVPHAA